MNNARPLDYGLAGPRRVACLIILLLNFCPAAIAGGLPKVTETGDKMYRIEVRRDLPRDGFHHPGGIYSVALSPDGKIAASGCTGVDAFPSLPTWRLDSIILWDVATGKMLKQLWTRNTTVYALRFSSDGKRLVGDCGQSLIAWDVNSGKRLWKKKLDPILTRIMSLRFTSSDRQLIVQSHFPFAGVLLLLNSDNGKLVKKWVANGERRRPKIFKRCWPWRPLYLSPNQKYLAQISSFDDYVYHKQLNGNKMIVRRYAECWLDLYDATTRNKLWSWDKKNITIKDLTYSPDSGRLAVRLGTDVWVIPTKEGPRKAIKISLKRPPEQLLFTADNQLLALYETENKLTLWNVMTGKEHAGRLSLPSGSYSRDGTLRVDYRSEHVRIWNTKTGERIGGPIKK